MGTAEQLAKSISMTSGGVRVLLWDEQDDLVRALIVLFAAWGNLSVKPLLLSSVEESSGALYAFFEIPPATEEETQNVDSTLVPERHDLLLLFLAQAASSSIGPILNGWRAALDCPPGTLLVIRRADFWDFQRSAPDLSSFIGPKIDNASDMLSIWSEETARSIRPSLRKDVLKILKQLPGHAPSEGELKDWIKEHPPLGTE